MHLSTLFITHAGPIATLHLNRTERLNAFGNQGTIDLNTAADALAQADQTRVIIITGEGRTFSTGIDLKELAAGEIDMSYHHRWEGALRKFELMNKVVICAMHGYCIGGGLQLALACDLRIAAASTQFGLPAIKEGLIPGMGVWRLPRYVGMGRAKQWILSGQLLDAATAYAFGVLDHVTPDAELASFVQKSAEHYLAVPWASVLLSKQLTNRAFDQPFDAALADYFAAQTAAMQSADHHAAMQEYRTEQARKGIRN
jgi:enoyl-CoA hydratase/carnithine racemase